MSEFWWGLGSLSTPGERILTHLVVWTLTGPFGICMDRFHWTHCAVYEYVSDSCKRRLTVQQCRYAAQRLIVVRELELEDGTGTLQVRLRDGVGDPRRHWRRSRGEGEGPTGSCACRRPARRGQPRNRRPLIWPETSPILPPFETRPLQEKWVLHKWPDWDCQIVSLCLRNLFGLC